MIFCIVTIVFSIISFFQPWFFIGTIVAIVLAAGEYILELTHAEIFSSGAIAISSIALGILALALAIASIIVSLKTINAPKIGYQPVFAAIMLLSL